MMPRIQKLFANLAAHALTFTLLGPLLPSVEASTAAFSVNPNIPAYGSEGLIYTLGARVQKAKYQFVFDTDYANAPLSGNPVGDYVDQLITHNLGFVYAPNDIVQFDAVLPIVSYNRFSDPLSLTQSFSNQAGIGDMMLRAHFHVWRRHDDVAAVALIPYLTLPFGNENDYISDKYPRGGLVVAGDWRFTDRWYSAVNLGIEGRQPVDLFDYELKGRWLVSGGVKYAATDHIDVHSDIVLSTALDKPFQHKVSTPMEWLIGTDVALKNHPITLHANGGMAVIRGATAPRVRVQAGATYAFGVVGERVPRSEKHISPKASSRKSRGAPSAQELQDLEVSLSFPKKSTKLSAEDQSVLNRVAQTLTKYPKLKIFLLQEHFDARRGKAKQKAGLARAAAVKNYLVAQGVSVDRIAVETTVGKKRNVWVKVVR